MKSYLKFLSRNKLYTAIEAVGLVVSLAFVVIIACYVIQQFAVSREVPDYQRVYSLNSGHADEFSAFPGELSIALDRVPDVETGARMDIYGTGAKFDGKRISGSPSLCRIDPEFFDFFPVEFLSGSPEVLQDKSQVILGESFARKISPDMDPVGKPIILSRDSCVIGGIVRISENSLLKEHEIFQRISEPDVVPSVNIWKPVNLVLIRFREGADIKSSRTLIDTLVRKEYEIFRKNPPELSMTMPVKDLYFSPRNESEFNKGNITLVYVLIAVGILLLASALFNYINLSVALAGKRAKEMAIRSTLGESRGRISWRYVSEAILFVAVCMALALLMAKWLEPVFNRYVAGDIGLKVAFSWKYLIIYLLIAIIVGGISGLAPAWMTSRIDPVSIIKGEQRRQTKTIFSKVFIVIQNVITVALISLALVMELQYKHLINMPLGADITDLYYISSGTVGRDELAAKPYIDKIGSSQGFPGNMFMNLQGNVNGRKIKTGILKCDEDAFEMLRFEKVKDFGRPLEGSLWFSEAAAGVYELDEENPVVPEAFTWVVGKGAEIGGIIKDFAIKGPQDISGDQVGAVYVGKLEWESTMLLKLNSFDSNARAELREIGRQESIRLHGNEEQADDYGLCTELIERGMDKTRNFIRLIELFMLVAIIISLLGLVAMSAYYAGMRTKDIAVRKVFGGTIGSETRRSVSEYMILVGIAVIIGIPIAIFLSERYLRQFWYRIDGYGWVFAVAAVIALLISLLAVLWQTLKAARTNPATELKKE